MRLKKIYLGFLLVSILACGSPFATAPTPPPRVTRLGLARFSTATPTINPTATTIPISSPMATLTPTPLPTNATSRPTEPLEAATLAAQNLSTVIALPTATLPPIIVPPTPAVVSAAAELAVPEPLAPLSQASIAPLTPDQYHLGYGVQLAEAKNMELAVPGGFTWAKHDLNIRKNMNFLSNADNLLSDLKKYGTEHVLVKLIVWGENGLPDAPRTSNEISTYAKNAAEAAEFIRQKHGPDFKTIAYEIWNEPNLNYEWEGNPNPTEFVNLLKAASEAIRQADPQAVIVSGAPSPGGDYDDLKFLEDMYVAGAKGLIDAVGSHPYGGPWPPEHPDGIDPNGNGYPFFRKPEKQRAIMERYGDTTTQIWATEFSWLAGVPGCNFGEHTAWQVSIEQQADYLVTAYTYAHQNWPWMGPMFVVYDFGLTGRYDRCHPAGGYSILRPDPNSDTVLTPAAAALFAMPKYAGW